MQSVNTEVALETQCEKRYQPGYEYEDGDEATPGE